ncbi:outer membrane protein [Mesorhizobium marinum]|uniref:Outer membrane protein n=1 Tax=Mesorhizobium marinum TaxID=3228790 RepID=A0ABV3R3W2_9HYPH
MTKLTKILFGAASAVAIASAVHAADAVVEEAPVAGYNWGGFYVGLGVGAGANVARLSGLGGGYLDGFGAEGVFGELTVGYDYMVSPRFLFGALADVHYSGVETRLGSDASASDTYGFDLGLRAGYLLTPSTLGYMLGGYAWQKGEIDGFMGPGSDLDSDRDGYFLGVGVETAVAGNWTLKTEYRFTQFGTNNLLEDLGAPDGIFDSDVSSHTFRVGANYRFGMNNGGGASFEVPAYNWTGFYVGGALGAGAGVYELGGEFNGLGGEGIFGELNVGYDHDFGNWVAGVQVDGRYSGISTEISMGGGSISLDADYGFDILARAGLKMSETTLAYALAGYSWQHFEFDVPSIIGDGLDWDSSGFSVGGGLETAVTENVSLNLEYRYSQYDSEDFDGGPDGIEPSFHTVRVGAKYKFN